MNEPLTRVHENPEAEIVRLQHELSYAMAANARAERMQVALSNMLHCGNQWPAIVDAVRDLMMEHSI